MTLTGNELKGAFVAIVTPFRNGQVDEKGLKKLIEFQIQNGTHGIVALGTTGESPTLTGEEKERILNLVVETVQDRLPVIAGTGSNNTLQALQLTQMAQKAGVKAVLSVVPYYNKPTQEGLFQHFDFLANEGELPIVLYNIPGRSGVNMSAETILRLAENKNIIGIKEASGSLDQCSQILAHCPKHFRLLAGDDSLTLPILALGGWGVVSTTSNVAPKLMAELCNAFFEGNWQEARYLHFRLLPLFNALFCESNPVPAKTALSLMGVIANEVRLPLASLTPENTERVRKVIAELKLL